LQKRTDKAALLVNIGSPNSPSEKDVRDYLAQFLMDPEVIDYPKWLRWLLVHQIVLRTRPKKSAEAYQKIWTDDGSPLVAITKKLVDALNQKSDIKYYMAMSYGSHTIPDVLKNIKKEMPDLKELITIPLYPHYATSTVRSAINTLTPIANQLNIPLSIKPIFFDHPEFRKAQIQHIRDAIPKDCQHLVFSYHGIPNRHVTKLDPSNHCLSTPNCCHQPFSGNRNCYRHQTQNEAKDIAAALDIKSYSVCYQSRLGPETWLQPNTEEILKELPGLGKKHVAILCPSFVTDCLETLEEIQMRGRDLFMSAGGSTFHYIPCLNINLDWQQFLLTYSYDA